MADLWNETPHAQPHAASPNTSQLVGEVAPGSDDSAPRASQPKAQAVGVWVVRCCVAGLLVGNLNSITIIWCLYVSSWTATQFGSWSFALKGFSCVEIAW